MIFYFQFIIFLSICQAYYFSFLYFIIYYKITK